MRMGLDLTDSELRSVLGFFITSIEASVSENRAHTFLLSSNAELLRHLVDERAKSETFLFWALDICLYSLSSQTLIYKLMKIRQGKFLCCLL